MAEDIKVNVSTPGANESTRQVNDLTKATQALHKAANVVGREFPILGAAIRLATNPMTIAVVALGAMVNWIRKVNEEAKKLSEEGIQQSISSFSAWHSAILTNIQANIDLAQTIQDQSAKATQTAREQADHHIEIVHKLSEAKIIDAAQTAAQLEAIERAFRDVAIEINTELHHKLRELQDKTNKLRLKPKIDIAATKKERSEAEAAEAAAREPSIVEDIMRGTADILPGGRTSAFGFLRGVLMRGAAALGARREEGAAALANRAGLLTRKEVQEVGKSERQIGEDAMLKIQMSRTLAGISELTEAIRRSQFKSTAAPELSAVNATIAANAIALQNEKDMLKAAQQLQKDQEEQRKAIDALLRKIFR